MSVQHGVLSIHQSRPIVVAELDVGILYNQSNVTTAYVGEGGDLPEAIVCGVSPDTTGYNDALTLKWRRADGTSIPLLTSSVNTISQISSGQQELYVKNVSLDDEGWYVCEYTTPEVNQTNNASLQILVNGLCIRLNIHLSFSGRYLVLQLTVVGVNGVVALSRAVLATKVAQGTILQKSIVEENA